MAGSNKIKNIVFWFLTPLLDNQNKPSIRRGLALYFSYHLVNYVYRCENVVEGVALAYVGLIIALLSLTTAQNYFMSTLNKNKEEEPKEP